jgi:hypothetical protein
MLRRNKNMASSDRKMLRSKSLKNHAKEHGCHSAQ